MHNQSNRRLKIRERMYVDCETCEQSTPQSTQANSFALWPQFWLDQVKLLT